MARLATYSLLWSFVGFFLELNGFLKGFYCKGHTQPMNARENKMYGLLSKVDVNRPIFIQIGHIKNSNFCLDFFR